MSKLINHAMRELSLLLVEADNDKSNDSIDMQEYANSCILELIEVFSNQGHSGFSSEYTIKTFCRLARLKPLRPLTGEDNEWLEVCKGIYQNKRCSSVFKEGKDGKAYNINARFFSDDNGKTFYANKESSNYIEFPYIIPEEPEVVMINNQIDKDV